MREGAATVDVAQRPDTRNVGAKLVVNLDKAARIHRDAGFIEPQVVGVGHASDRQQQVRADDVAWLPFATHVYGDAVTVPGDAQAFGVEPECNAFGLEYRLNRCRYFLIFVGDEPRRHFDNRDAAAEAPIHLRELETDVTAADDKQMLGQEIDFHHAAVGQVRNIGDPRHLGNARPSSDIDKDLVGFQQCAVDAYATRPLEPRVALDQRHVRRTLEPVRHTSVR